MPLHLEDKKGHKFCPKQIIGTRICAAMLWSYVVTWRADNANDGKERWRSIMNVQSLLTNGNQTEF